MLEIRRVEQGDAPHQAPRLRAVLAAYDQLLLELCERVDVPTDDVGLPPLPSRERLDPRGRAGGRRPRLVSSAGRARHPWGDVGRTVPGGKERHAARAS